VAKGCTDAEIASFLELAARYDLDPFAKEIWCAKDKKDSRVLIMVGRDGLRKIAQRQGLHIDGDVVRANDEFGVSRRGDGVREVTHSYGHEKDRGAIVGAWCQVTGRGNFPMGIPSTQVGFFYAPISEYKPRGASEYSPWSKQTSVMILAAAERQALRQATPLSGLLAEGEDESAMAQLTAGEGTGEPVGWKDISDEQVMELEKLMRRAEARGHAGFAHRPTVEMIVNGQTERFIADWISLADEQLAEMKVTPARAEEVADVLADVAETPVKACGDSSEFSEVRDLSCELAEGHEGPHLADGVRWERFADDDPTPGQESLDAELDTQAAEEAER
jgi:hypothetical protein